MKSIFKKSHGFTLAEILVVLAIIFVLASVVLASVTEARKNSRDKARIIDVEQLQLTFRLYLELNDAYPSSGGSPVAITSVAGLSPFGALPVDPLDNATYRYEYNSAYTCNGSTESVVYATTMETDMTNEDSVCGGTGGTKYIIVLK